jgi:hypothetical protein
MFSLFCVPVCVVAHPNNSAVHEAATLVKKVRFSDVMGYSLVVDIDLSNICCATALKIHAPLNKRPIQGGLISKTAGNVVELQPTPPELGPEPPAYLNLQAALNLIGPILA